MQLGIGQWVSRRAFLNGGRTALISNGAHITYADLDRRTNQVAAALIALGVRKGDRVAMLLVNSTEFIEVLLGCAKIGALAVPLNVRLAGPEIGYILADSGADVLVFHEPFAAQARSAVTESGVRVRHVVRAGGVPAPGELGYEDVVSGAAPEPLNGDVDGRDPAFIMYTSGTTGRPKGVWSGLLPDDQAEALVAEVTSREHGLGDTACRAFAVPPEAHPRVAEVLERFGLSGHADQPAHLLSGGQKQLLALATVLVTEPAVVVADEPTTLLDLRNARMLRAAFADLDTQLIVVTHDLDLIQDADRVIVLDEGRVVADDAPTAALAVYRRLMG